MEKVLERSNLAKAYRSVYQNQGAPGIDGMKVKLLRPYLKQNWPQIKQELLAGTYQPKPVRRVEIPKQDGGVRVLGIPTVLDRFIQQALHQVLTLIFDPLFSNNSYGFRPERSAHQAIEKAQYYINQGRNSMVDIDLEKFFDRINHDILMAKVMEKVKDIRVIKVIRRYLQVGIMINGMCKESEEGAPQGGPLSPLLANIMLDELDKELEKRQHAFVRYADDCNIYVASKRAGERVYQSIKQFIEKKLKLKVNENKSAVAYSQQRAFLGFSFYRTSRESGIQLRVAKKSVERLKEKIRKITRRNDACSMDKRILQLKYLIRGWSRYFALAENKILFSELDSWIRRRLRMCLFKQWKLCKTKLSNLIKLGIKKEEAIQIAYSRKNYWRLSHTPQLNRALNKKYWREQGLMSILDVYYELRVSV